MTMPNFLIIGAPKAGTSALYHYLQQHPQIYMSPMKETKFFAFEGEQINFQGPGDSTLKYITDIEAYRALFKHVSNEVAIGEATPWYLYSPKAAERIQSYIPNAKLIAILRDPVERAHSHFLSHVSRGWEPLNDFSQAMLAEEDRIRNNWSYPWYYKQRGFYAVQLKRYFERFDRNQIKVYLYEDFKADSQSILKNIFQFLGVDNSITPNTDRKYNVTNMPTNRVLDKFIKCSSPIKPYIKPLLLSKLGRQIKTNFLKLNSRNKPSLSTETRRQFVEEYKEDILKLQDLIQRDLSQWLIS